MAGQCSFSLQGWGAGGRGECISPCLHMEIVLAQQFNLRKALLMMGILYWTALFN